MVETKKDQIDNIALKGISFYLSKTKQYLNGIPLLKTSDRLVQLPVEQIGFIVSIVIMGSLGRFCLYVESALVMIDKYFACPFLVLFTTVRGCP